MSFGQSAGTMGAYPLVGTAGFFTGGMQLAGPLVGARRNIINPGAARTLTAAESASLCLFSTAAGYIYTLPAPASGLWYEFLCTATISSANAEIDTDAGTTFLLGLINVLVENSATSKGFGGNGTSHVKAQLNGSTSGGVKGSRLVAYCYDATHWQIDGNVLGVGGPTTPWA